MKKDSLEKFMENNRHHFDDKTPSEKVWHKISSALSGASGNSPWNSLVLWRSAAAVLLGISIYLFTVKTHPVNAVRQDIGQQEFRDIETFYSAQISEKVALVANEGLFADDSFTQDLQKLEAMYTVLAEEMKKHPSEKVRDVMVLNMLVRIDLLNQQIQRLEESKRNKDKEPSTI